MSDARTIRQQVEARLTELEGLMVPLRAEQETLAAVAATFEAPAADPPRRPATTAPPRPPATRSARPTGGGASRAQQAVALIAAQPGLSAADLAGAMGIGRNYLYRVLPKLQRRGVVVKRGSGYHPGSAD